MKQLLILRAPYCQILGHGVPAADTGSVRSMPGYKLVRVVGSTKKLSLCEKCVYCWGIELNGA